MQPEIRHWFPGERRDLRDIPDVEMADYLARLESLPPIGWTFLKVVVEGGDAHGVERSEDP